MFQEIDESSARDQAKQSAAIRADRPRAKAKEKRRPKETKPLKPSSQLAYEKDVRLFRAAGGKVPCDAAALSNHIWMMRNRLSPKTLYRRAMAVRSAHISIGLVSPTDDPSIRPLLRALQLGYVPDRKWKEGANAIASAGKKRRAGKQHLPITRRLLREMLEPLPRNLLDRRDRAIVLLGFSGAIKRGQLVSLDVGDVRFSHEAMLVRIRVREQSVADEGHAEASPHWRQLAIPITGGELCAATAVMRWIESAALDAEPRNSPLFRRFDRGGDPTGHRLEPAYVNSICKKLLRIIGVDPTPYSAHSLLLGRRAEIAKGVI
jgi:integrase